MPLPKRCVQPVHVARGVVNERLTVPSELEAVTNGTLANTVRQLSSLSKHAEDMFGELTREATNIGERTNVLQARIDRLAIKVTQLDSGVEEVSLQDIQMRKAFRSSRTIQQQLFSRNSMPSPMLDTYAHCDPPPPLEQLNEFRDDGRDARKFYTDPNYFFDLWLKEMLQDTERMQHDKGKKVRQPRSGSGESRGGRRPRVPHLTREKQKDAAVKRGEHIMSATQLRDYNNKIERHTPDPIYSTAPITDGGYRAPQRSQMATPARPNSIEIEHQNRPKLTGNGHVIAEESGYGSVGEPVYGSSGGGTPRRARPSQPPPAPPPLSHPSPTTVSSAQNTPDRTALPPPPPPPDSASPPPLLNGASTPIRNTLDAHLERMHRVIDMMSSDEDPQTCAPPPPPPPEPPTPPAAPSPPGGAGEDRPAPPSPGALVRGASALKPATLRTSRMDQPDDPRSDLLKAIRDGIQLRKVEKREDTGRYDTLRGAPTDVASILQRRIYLEQSSSSESESDSYDSDQWNESRA